MTIYHRACSNCSYEVMFDDCDVQDENDQIQCPDCHGSIWTGYILECPIK